MSHLKFPLTVDEELLGELYGGSLRPLSFSYLLGTKFYKYIAINANNNEDYWSDCMLEAYEGCLGLVVEDFATLMAKTIINPSARMYNRSEKIRQQLESNSRELYIEFEGESFISTAVEESSAEVAQRNTFKPLKYKRAKRVLSKYLKNNFNGRDDQSAVDIEELTEGLLKHSTSREANLGMFSDAETSFLRRLKKRDAVGFKKALKAAFDPDELGVYEQATSL